MINGIVIERGPFKSIWLRAGCVDKVIYMYIYIYEYIYI